MRVGVVGVGHLGKEHARIYAGMKGVELVGVADLDAEQARAVARKCRTQAVPAESLYDRVDAVSIAVPTVAHYQAARPFIERGISVLIEKPMTFQVEEAEELLRIATKSGARIQVGHIERFNPGFRAIASQPIKPLFVECHRLSPFRFRSADIGVVFDLMIHDLDIVQFLMKSEVERVEAVGVPVICQHEDIANARLTFSNGCVANLTASRISLKALRRIRIFAPDCYVAIDTQDSKATIYRKAPGFDEVARKLRGASDLRTLLEMRKLAYGDLVESKSVSIGEREPLQMELESFIACVRDKTVPEVPGEDGLKAVRVANRVVTEIRKSLQTAGVPFAPSFIGDSPSV